MVKWEKSEVTVHGDGGKTIRYEAEGVDRAVESRKRAVPHADGVGCWFATTYFIIRPDGTEKEFYSLAAAKEAAERGR